MRTEEEAQSGSMESDLGQQFHGRVNERVDELQKINLKLAKLSANKASSWQAQIFEICLKKYVARHYQFVLLYLKKYQKSVCEHPLYALIMAMCQYELRFYDKLKSIIAVGI